MRWIRKVVLVLSCVVLVVVLTSCKDGPTSPAEYKVDGEWGGVLYEVFNIFLSLKEVKGYVYGIHGEGTISVTGGSSVELQVMGDREGTHVFLEIIPSGFQQFFFDAKLEDPNTLRGVVNGSGFINEKLVLKKR